MSMDFAVVAKGGKDIFTEHVSEGDAVTFNFDFTPWQEDNNTITGVTWTVESGDVAVSGETLTAGVASALLTFANAGKHLVSITAATGTETRKIWLEVCATDPQQVFDYGDDYGRI